jgi:DnaA family protein
MTALRQLLLDLQGERPPTLDSFVAGDSNLELLSRLRGLAAADAFDAIYLWGPPGSGRSHLLGAVADLAARHRPCLHFRGSAVGTELSLARGGLLVIDDIDALDAAAQSALFRFFIASASGGLALLLAGQQPPLRLSLREDLRTRIGQMLVYEIKPLTDTHKLAALQHHALQRHMRVDPSVLQYLLHHSRRDLPALLAVLEALDQVSLEQQRPPTLPLLREILQSAFEFEGQEP